MPRAPGGEIRRGALLTLLLGTRPGLTVLAAPAGYGKTTLLAQYARERLALGLPVVWLTVREADAAPDVLIASLLTCVEETLPGLETAPARRLLGRGNAHGAAEALTHILTGHQPPPELVLDQANLLGPDTLRVLAPLLGPRGPTTLLALYHHAPLGLAARVARGEARLLGPAELAFSPQESALLLARRAFGGDAAQAHRQVDGWPLGLGLLAHGGSAVGLDICDLVEEQLGRLSAGWQAALEEAGVLDTWSEAGLRELGVLLPPGGLSGALALGLPIAASTGGALRPHSLLVQALDLRLRRAPERYRALHARAASLAERSGDSLSAVTHFVRAGRVGDALRLAAPLAPAFERRAEHNVLRQLLEGFDEADLPPALGGLLGTALIETGEQARGVALLTRLHAAGQADARALVTLSDMARRAGDHAASWALVTLAQERAQDAYGVALAQRHRASLLWEAGHGAEAFAEAVVAVERAQRVGDPIALAYALGLRGLGHHARGSGARAEADTRRALELLDSIGLPWRTMTVRNNVATLMALRGDAQGALAMLAPAVQHADEVLSKHQALLYTTRADIAFSHADFGTAQGDYGRALAAADTWGSTPSSVARMWARLSETRRRGGDPQGAALALQRAELVAPAGLRAAAQSELKLQRALVAWAAGGAADDLDALLDTALGPEPDVNLRVHLYRAEAARRRGQAPDEALALAVRCLDQMGGDGLLRIDAQVLAALYDLAAQPGRWPERFGPYRTPTAPAPTPAILNAALLGRPTFALNGHLARFPFARCAELLAYVALHGPRRREQIVDALWQGSRSDSHREYFRVVVRRVRAALIQAGDLDFNPLPYQGGVYALSDRLTLDLDYAALVQTPPSEEPGRLRAALDAYGGPLLDGLDSAWIEELRLHAAEHALHLALSLGRRLEASDLLAAPAAYRQALKLDPWAADAHQGLVRSLQALGDEAGVALARAARQRAHREVPEPGEPRTF